MAYQIRFSNLARLVLAHEDGFKRGATQSAKMGADIIKTTMRQHIRSRLGGRKGFANTLRSRSFPTGGGRSASPTIWTHSTAPEIHTALNEGTVIRPSRGEYLAIPVRSLRRGRFARAAGRRRITPKNWSQTPGFKGRELVPARKRNRLYLVDSETGKVQFTLRRSVAIPKKLNLDGAYADALSIVRDEGVVNITNEIIREATQVDARPR